MTRRIQGQAASEYLVCVSVLAVALFLPFVEGVPVATYLARQIVAWFHGLHSLLALS